ncbi:MAG: NAD(P)-dependent oxidoreductase [Spirochaetaceae bacterium]|nr:MAG: NAD(P)-dependent oxidoreductase [Spirochaetaceae bacterium]
MAVFITGGYGHIGSWMVKRFVQSGESVIVYDCKADLPDYLERASSSIHFICGDVLDRTHMTEVFRKQGRQIDGIVHTVGIMGEFVAENPYDSVRLNIIGTLNLLEIARQYEIEKVLYVSTGAVYGVHEGIAAEQVNPPPPADLYAATKLSSEYLGLQYADSFGLDFRIGRVYFIYGPGKLPSDFVRLYRVAFGALEGIPDPGADRGADQKLDFTYVDDAARGLVMLYQAEEPKHRIYNIATGQATSVGKIADLSAKYASTGLRYRIGPGMLMPRCEALDISRAEQEFGYTPEVTLDEGIRLYAAWLKYRAADRRRSSRSASRRNQ